MASSGKPRQGTFQMPLSLGGGKAQVTRPGVPTALGNVTARKAGSVTPSTMQPEWLCCAWSSASGCSADGWTSAAGNEGFGGLHQPSATVQGRRQESPGL